MVEAIDLVRQIKWVYVLLYSVDGGSSGSI